MSFYDHLRESGANLPDMPVFDASSIAQMLDETPMPGAESDEEGLLSWPMSYFDGILIPPFPRFFVESTTRVNTEKEIVEIRRGAMISDIGPKLDGSRWTLAVESYTKVGDQFFTPVGCALIGVGEKGNLITDPNETPVLPFRVSKPLGTKSPVQESPRYNIVVMLTLMAIHEKGDVVERQPSRQMKRMAERRGHPQPATVFELRHSVAVIKAGSPRFKFVSQKGEGGGKRNNNGRIGHIRMYGEKYGKGGLFGRKGEAGNAVLWIPAEGSGHKSYRIDVWN